MASRQEKDTVWQEEIMRQNRANSPLLDLPGELRNNIYCHLHLFEKHQIVVGPGRRLRAGPINGWINSKYKVVKTARSLLSTSKLIRNEVNPLFFRRNHFKLTEFETFAEFIKYLSDEQLNNIRSVRIVESLASGLFAELAKITEEGSPLPISCKALDPLVLPNLKRLVWEHMGPSLSTPEGYIPFVMRMLGNENLRVKNQPAPLSTSS